MLSGIHYTCIDWSDTVVRPSYPYHGNPHTWKDDLCIKTEPWPPSSSLHWRHNDHDSVSNHQPHGCLLNRLFRYRSKKTSKLHVTGLCVGNSPRIHQLREKCFHLMTSSCNTWQTQTWPSLYLPILMAYKEYNPLWFSTSLITMTSTNRRFSALLVLCAGS